MVQGSAFRVWDSRFRVWGVRVRVQGFRVSGLGPTGFSILRSKGLGLPVSYNLQLRANQALGRSLESSPSWSTLNGHQQSPGMAGMGALEEVGDMQGRVLRFEAKITLSKSKGLGAAHPQ